MKIICIKCHKIIGEQEPLKERTYVQAKCPECILAEQAISFEILRKTIKEIQGK